MADAPASSGSTGIDFSSLIRRFARGDVAMAVGVLAILVMLILPMPRALLDISLAISICFSVMVLMTALFIRTPLDRHTGGR